MGVVGTRVVKLSPEEARRIDERLSALGRGEGAVRLRIGEVAAEIERRSHFHALGFSNYADYAEQGCTFGKAWLNAARRVAKRLSSLPHLREGLATGELSWSMAEVCSRRATPENDAEVLARAKHSTVRQLEAWLREQVEAAANEASATEAATGGAEAATDGADGDGADGDGGDGDGADGDGGDAHARENEEECNELPSGRAANLTLLGQTDENDVPSAPSVSAQVEHERVDPAWLPLDLSERAAELDMTDELDRLRRRTVQRAVPFEDRVAFEVTKLLAVHVTGSQRLDVTIDALLSEAESTLIHLGAVDMLEVEAQLEEQDEQWGEWLQLCATQRDEGEASCESQIPVPVTVEPHESLGRPLPTTAQGLDDELVKLCRELSNRDLEIGVLAERLFCSDQWHTLKYASVRHYARERMGVSKSTLEHKRTLARRAVRLPELAAAVAEDRIGYAVALKIGRIATPETVQAWIERAERRTVKHLDEEIRASEMLARTGAMEEIRPPTGGELAAVFALEQTLLEGELLPKPPKGWRDDEHVSAGAAASQVSETTASDAESMVTTVGGDAPRISDAVSSTRDDGGPPQMSDVGAPSAMLPMVELGDATLDGAARESDDPFQTMVAAAREELLGMMKDDGDRVQGLPKAFAQVFRNRGMAMVRLRLPDHLVLRWKALEASHGRIRGKRESFLAFLCMVAWREWGHEIDVEVAFKHIHARDRFQCLCPVCTKRNVGPHHIRRRSKGGNDTKENNVSACYVCHIEGIHGQCWLKVERTPKGLRWTIGHHPTLVVEGREVVLNRGSSPRRAA